VTRIYDIERARIRKNARRFARDAVERSRPADHVVITLGLGSDYHAVTYSGDKPDGAPRLGNVIPFRPRRRHV